MLTRRPGPLPLDMHHPDAEDAQVLRQLGAWTLRRLSRRGLAQPPRPAPRKLAPITEQGVGTRRAWDELCEQVLPSAFPTDHPGYLAFVPGSPSVAAVLADMAVSASGVYAGSELEAGAVVTAERDALRWLAELAGLPATAHGTFVSGGSMANLSALVAARHAVRARTGRRPMTVIAGAAAHSSVASAADIMGCDVRLAGHPGRRLTAADLTAALAGQDLDDVVAVVATAGATNTGLVDDLAEIAAVCRQRGVWLHVDAAYGGAALLAERTRGLFTGLGEADSVTMDPHKWFFTPFDCAAVLYADPAQARRAHTQQASYLSVTADGDNPSDYAVHLSRRAAGPAAVDVAAGQRHRGLPGRRELLPGPG